MTQKNKPQKIEFKLDVGRPSKYIKDFHHLCALGAFWDNTTLSQTDLAKILNISTSTLNLWLLDHKEFSEAVEKGRSNTRNVLIGTGIREATGYYYQEEFLGKNGEIVKLERYARPLPAILKLMLSNVGIREQTESIEKTELTALTPEIIAKLSTEEKALLNKICEKLNNASK